MIYSCRTLLAVSVMKESESLKSIPVVPGLGTPVDVLVDGGCQWVKLNPHGLVIPFVVRMGSFWRPRETVLHRNAGIHERRRFRLKHPAWVVLFFFFLKSWAFGLLKGIRTRRALGKPLSNVTRYWLAFQGNPRRVRVR